MKRNNVGAPVMIVHRLTRPPLSCRPCREKKRRCDRNRPCSNCSQRGILCEYPSRNQFVESHVEEASTQGAPSAIGSSTSSEQPALNPSEVLDRLRRLEEAVFSASGVASRARHTDNNAVSHGTPFSFHNANTSPARVQQHAAHVAHLAAQLPPVDQARTLFEHFVSALHPSLFILHIPSTRAQLESTYRCILGAKDEPAIDVLLMLFSIFAGAALSWTPRLLRELNAAKESAKSAFETYTHFAMSILDDARRPVAPSTTALAAIATLAHVVLNADDSFPARALTLRTRCILMCRAMQLHRLDTATSRKERRLQGANSIDIEVQRRIWWSLVASDWLTAFSGSPHEGIYTFMPRQMNVRYPCNVDNDMMTLSDPVPDFPLSTPTEMSCFIQRIKLADLCREIVDTIPPMIEESTEADYEVILRLDRKLRDMRDNLPMFLRLDEESIHKSQAICQERPYITWQRITLHFSLHTRICLLHRPYYLDGDSNPKYAYSFDTIMASAYTILELRRRMDDEGAGSNFCPERYWIILQHVTTAAVILATLVSCSPNAPDAEARKEKVMAAYRTLERSKKDASALIKGIEKNMETILATLPKEPPQGPSLVTDRSSSTTMLAPQSSRVGMDLDGSLSPKFDEPSVDEPYDGMGDENSHQLWSDFLAAIPDLSEVQWESLLNHTDLDFGSNL